MSFLPGKPFGVLNPIKNISSFAKNPKSALTGGLLGKQVRRVTSASRKPLESVVGKSLGPG